MHGTVHPDFADVARRARAIIPRKRPGGGAICVWHRGQQVVDLWGGTRDRAGNPWQADTLGLSFSTTKGMASTLLHMLVDRGLIGWDDRVADYWPEFAQAGKQDISVRQVMCHEAGLYRIADMIPDGTRIVDWEHMVDVLARARPAHEPGRAHGYHALTYGFLVGEIARRVTGKSFPELLRSELAEPLGLDGLYCGVPGDQLDRCSELIDNASGREARYDGDGDGNSEHAGEDGAADLRAKLEGQGQRFAKLLRLIGVRWDAREMTAALMPPGLERVNMNSESWWTASIPAANGMFTARSLARVYAVLAAGGELDGVKLMSPQTLRQATRIQNTGAGRVIPISMRWRLGYHRVFTTRGRAPRGFGHFGYGGSGAWADPDRDLAVALVVNSGSGSPFGDVRIARLGSVAIRCADRR